MGQRGTVRAGDYNFFCGKGNEKSSIGNRIFFVHHRKASAITGLIWLRIGTGSGHL